MLANDDDVETMNEMTMFEKSTSKMSKYEMTMWFDCETKTKMMTNSKMNISIDAVDDDVESDDGDGIEAMAIDSDDDNHVVDDRTTIFVEVRRSVFDDVFYRNSDCLSRMNDGISKSFSRLFVICDDVCHYLYRFLSVFLL